MSELYEAPAALPDNDSDFTPDLARKIIAKYQQLIEWLREENRKLSADRDDWQELAEKWRLMPDTASAEIERLWKENKNLRATLLALAPPTD